MKIVSILLVLLIGKLSAVQFHEIDTTYPLKCTFSNEHQNRIAIKDGRILKAIFPEGKISVQMEEESGQIFVFPMKHYQEETTLSIVSENGYVQDLEIHFGNRSAEVVILSELGTKCSESQDVSDDVHRIEEIISEIMCGKIPKGFVAFEEYRREQKIDQIGNRILARFEGDNETIFLHLLKNHSDTDICFGEQILNTPSNWIFLAQNILEPGHDTVAIRSVLRPNE